MQKLRKFILKTALIILCGFPFIAHTQNIYWLESRFNSPRLVRSDTSGNELLSISLPPASLPQNIALDIQRNQLYWTELRFINSQIYKTTTDFSSVSSMLNGQSVLRGIAVDPLNKKIYWTSTNLIDGPKISRSDLNGQSQTVLINFGPASNNTPRSIALDMNAGKMYWTNFSAGKIQRADTTVGAVPEDIIKGLNGPAGIAVEASSARLFWTEMNGHQIKSADLDGNNIILLVDSLSYPNSISVNGMINRMAWTETGTGKIKSASLDGTELFEYKISATAPAGIVLDPSAPEVISGNLQIIPLDTTIQIHNYIQYKAQIVDSNHVVHPTRADWYVKRQHIGPIKNSGLLFSYFPGQANIMAKWDSMVAKARLNVIDSNIDSSAVNKIKIIQNFHKGHSGKHKIFKEGETYTIAGLPSPYNIINGSMIYFPKSSLQEDITVKVELPEFHRVKNDSIYFANRILNGINFDVYAGDSLIKPFYFNRPLSISIPYKRGLLKKFGIDPSKLNLFYAMDSTTFDTLGIHHVMVDTSHNRIYALVDHFSSLVIREKEDVTATSNITKDNDGPLEFELKQNYPNPFNPITNIEYQIAYAGQGTDSRLISNFTYVNLSVYNLLGQKVATLVDKKQAAGRYKVEWNATGLSSGVYFYSIQTANGYRQTRKLILLK